MGGTERERERGRERVKQKKDKGVDTTTLICTGMYHACIFQIDQKSHAQFTHGGGLHVQKPI